MRQPSETEGGQAATLPAAVGRAADTLGAFEVPMRSHEQEDYGLLARDSRFRRLLVCADALSAIVVLLVTVYVVAGEQLTVGALTAIPVIVVASKALGLYDRDELLLHKATLDEAPQIFQLSILFTLFVWLFESMMVIGDLEKVQFVTLATSTLATTLAARAIARRLAHATALPERVLFLGSEESFETMKGKLALGPQSRTELTRHELENEAGEVIVNGGLEELLREHDIQRIVIAPAATDSEAVLNLIREAKMVGAKVSLMPRFSEVLGSSVAFDELHGIILLAVRQLQLSRSSLVLKRLFDITLAGIGLLVMAPVSAVVAAAIKLTSRGPVLFRQERIGRNGKPFEILKFRTMVHEAERLRDGLDEHNEAEGLFKIHHDPRVTRVGRILRRTSLDELPQLLNVLRGDMSLVGPRPLVAEDDRQVEGWYRQRLNIAPGMTGHWQVLGSARIPLEEMVAIDYLYVVNWSIWLDLKYLLRTVPFVLRLRGL